MALWAANSNESRRPEMWGRSPDLRADLLVGASAPATFNGVPMAASRPPNPMKVARRRKCGWRGLQPAGRHLCRRNATIRHATFNGVPMALRAANSNESRRPPMWGRSPDLRADLLVGPAPATFNGVRHGPSGHP